MSKQQAEQIARQYVQAHKEQLGRVSPEALETAVKRVAGALRGMKSAK